MIVIGIVGGVGAGKSYVASLFGKLGAVVVDADRIGHEVLNDPSIRCQLQSLFGMEIVAATGEVDRKRLAHLVFGAETEHANRLQQLESVTHPEIEKRLRNKLDELRARGVVAAVLDAAVMMRTGWHRVCDVLVFVEADEETRWSRVASRGWNREEWEFRESRQTSLVDAKSACRWAILNGGQVSPSPWDQVNLIWERLGLGDRHHADQPEVIFE
ncbi:MAG TPA: dephospho-CoA kinase [Pirellulaceae bacterium]|nr:dephospho-CoA kinase [Pirellulaceae bacterium]